METDLLLAVVMCVTALIAAWWFHLLLKWSSGGHRRRRYGPVFKTNLVGKDMIVSLELNSYVLKQDNRAFQIWYPESLKRILGAVLEVTSSESLHKRTRTMVLRVFGPENLRLVLLRDVQGAARSNLSSVTAKLLINYDASTSSAGELWKHYDAFTNGLMSFPVNIPGTAFYKCLKGRKNIMEALKHMLDERKEAAERRETMDFLDLVVDELKEKPVLDENFCLDVLFGLLFASIHTTSTALTAALKFLTDNPKALQELQKGRCQSEITWEEYKSMKFTSNDISEPIGGSKDFLVFGLGLRSCLGADFAKLQIATFLHCLVTNYRWEVVSGGDMVLSPVLLFPNGFHVKLIEKT
ncbi:hypothetical protein C2845_PM06G08090 [Panicum miliaceum]|uniref:Cytochrome P450 87A3-like n=1 Tax=Panicum miliaceum TaxID=4540 RepID=A0A3L6REE8_PANMI|nr:hypothetical protein C2845_PM06G08090 [Panicum miliaceum]